MNSAIVIPIVALPLGVTVGLTGKVVESTKYGLAPLGANAVCASIAVKVGVAALYVVAELLFSTEMMKRLLVDPGVIDPLKLMSLSRWSRRKSRKLRSSSVSHSSPCSKGRNSLVHL